jgi:50S ribosomal protein L30P, archaeal
MVFCAVRIRGSIGVPKEIKDTLRMLHLTRVNHSVFVDENSESYRGMLERVKDYIAWGKIDKDTIRLLLEKRAKMVGNKPLSKSSLKSSGFDDLDKFAEAIVNNKIDYNKIEGVKPLFRLSPPKKGYKGTKRGYREGGSLGFRDGESMSSLIRRMV